MDSEALRGRCPQEVWGHDRESVSAFKGIETLANKRTIGSVLQIVQTIKWKIVAESEIKALPTHNTTHTPCLCTQQGLADSDTACTLVSTRTEQDSRGSHSSPQTPTNATKVRKDFLECSKQVQAVLDSQNWGEQMNY